MKKLLICFFLLSTTQLHAFRERLSLRAGIDLSSSQDQLAGEYMFGLGAFTELSYQRASFEIGLVSHIYYSFLDDAPLLGENASFSFIANGTTLKADDAGQSYDIAPYIKYYTPAVYKNHKVFFSTGPLFKIQAFDLEPYIDKASNFRDDDMAFFSSYGAFFSAGVTTPWVFPQQISLTFQALKTKKLFLVDAEDTKDHQTIEVKGISDGPFERSLLLSLGSRIF